MRLVTFTEFANLPICPAQPGPCQAHLPNGRQCRRPASRASGHHKCSVHDHGRALLGADEVTGTGRWAVTTRCGGHTKVSLHPTDEAARRVLDWLRGGCTGRCTPSRHRITALA